MRKISNVLFSKKLIMASLIYSFVDFISNRAWTYNYYCALLLLANVVLSREDILAHN